MSFSDNTSFVLKKIHHTEFEPRPIPESEFKTTFTAQKHALTTNSVGAHDVLVEVKKTGEPELLLNSH